MIRGAAVIVLLTASVAACGDRAEPPPPAARATTPAVTLVPLADLRAAVPVMDGWSRSEITVQELPAPARSTAASASFTRGVEKLDLEIADTGGDPRAIESLEHMAGSNVRRTVANGYFAGTTIRGHPAVESWNTVDKLGELSLLIQRRYIIHVAGSGLPDAAAMRALAEAVDTTRLR
jgi:hypothetical protein